MGRVHLDFRNPGGGTGFWIKMQLVVHGIETMSVFPLRPFPPEVIVSILSANDCWDIRDSQDLLVSWVQV